MLCFVDEAQDLSPLQWAVVRKLTEKNADRIYLQVMMIKQFINGQGRMLSI